MNLPVGTSKLKKIAKKIPEILAKKAFLVLIIIFIINLLISGFIFYQYYWQVQEKEIELTDQTSVLKEDALNEIINQLDQRQEQFIQTESKIYPDLFRF